MIGFAYNNTDLKNDLLKVIFALFIDNNASKWSWNDQILLLTRNSRRKYKENGCVII